jgi:DNA-binding beta-propeller fold protein YncE
MLRQSITANAATNPVSDPRILIHYDAGAGEQPENIVAEPDGHLILTLDFVRQIVRLTPEGSQEVLATLPAPPGGGAGVPVTHTALATGLVLTADGTIYVGYVAGDARFTGIWRLEADATPRRVTALPADSFPNGMAIDERSGELYIADSIRGAIWRAPISGGDAEVWAAGQELAPLSILGANGLKVHGGFVFVSNSDHKTLLRYPIGSDGAAGAVQTVASGYALDDFTFVEDTDVVAAALNLEDQVALIRPDGSFQPVLTADGLQTPSAVLVRSGRIYVLSSAHFTHVDPNILVADFAPST